MNDNNQDAVVEGYQERAENCSPVIYSRDEHCVSRKNIDEDALKILHRLIRHGYKAYLVGGGVRDLLLEKEPKDFDIATDATPRKIKALFRNCRIIGRRFKLAHIYFKNRKIIEVSTFRDFHDPVDLQEENEKENQMVTRDNRYGTEVTDAWRRDISINALFYDLSSFSIIDYVDGMQDLRNGLIRVIGDPEVRFVEDPVRLLRVVRHAGRAGFDIEESCKQAILKNNELILHSSPVRLFEEFKKDLSSGYLFEIFELSFEHRLLQHLLPELTGFDRELFSPASQFARTLKRLDELFREGENATVTACLSCLALMLKSPNSHVDEFAAALDSKEAVSDLLESCFVGLAVPKKERERIFDSIDLWRNLHTSDPEKLKVNTLERRRRIEDTFWIMKIFGLDSGPIFQKVEEARQKRLHSQSQKPRRKKGRGGRNRSHRGRQGRGGRSNKNR